MGINTRISIQMSKIEKVKDLYDLYKEKMLGKKKIMLIKRNQEMVGLEERF